MSEHYKLTHDEAWLRRVAPQLVKGCDWIVRERARTKVMENGQKVKHYGLLPKGRPSDLYIWDNWYWTDTYSYMGLRGTADVLAAIGMKDEAARLAAEADDYKACILDSIERSIDPKIKPPFVPPTPYRAGPPSFDFFDENWYAICSPIYMVEAGLLDARDEKDRRDRLLARKARHVQRPAAVRRRRDRSLLRLQPVARATAARRAGQVRLDALQPLGLRDGAGNLRDDRGPQHRDRLQRESWEANRQPHMHSNSRYIDMVRIALLLEEGDTLHLMAGTPRGWLADGEKIEVKRAPSYFGEVNFTARSHVGLGRDRDSRSSRRRGRRRRSFCTSVRRPNTARSRA